MADRFELFRLSLTPRPLTLFDDPAAAVPSRERYLRHVFEANHEFEHHGNLFVYVPGASQQSPFIIGQVGRPRVTRENLPPDQGFAIAEHEGWKAAVMVLDPREHDDGQKVAMNRDNSVGVPHAVLRSFVSYINGLQSASFYHCEVAPIFNPTSFWTFADEHKGRITTLTFDFVTPNMFGGADALSEELRRFRQAERAETVSVTLKSQDGIDTNTEKVKRSVEYAGKGAGKVRARAKGGRRYNSARLVDTVTIDGNADTDEPLSVRAARRPGEILGLSS